MWKRISVVSEPGLVAQSLYWPAVRVLGSLQAGTELLHHDSLGHDLGHQT